MRPDIGTQAQFRKKKPAQTYRYDSSLSPALDWDGQNAARELGEWLLECVEERVEGLREQGVEGSKKRSTGSPHAAGGSPKQFRNARGEAVLEVRCVDEVVEQLDLDVFDPTEMKTDHRGGADVPCWLLDTDYNSLCFHVCQAFFPRTAAWDDLKRSLKGEYDDSVWEHLAGTTIALFQPGEHGQVAVKVIDDRGNDLMVVRSLHEFVY